MKLPLLLSVPHAGLRVPSEVQEYCVLTRDEIVADGDEGAAEIYDIADDVQHYVTTDVARAIVDMNRAEDDRRADGIVKTHTCWNVPVYGTFPPEPVVQELLTRYYRPYHEQLDLPMEGVRLGVDCHTMAAFGPPIGPGAGVERPAVCLSNADGTCPREWLEKLAECFARAFEHEIAINEPFKGGYIIRTHCRVRSWLQLEISRAPFMENCDKRRCVLSALRAFCEEHGDDPIHWEPG